MNVKSGRPRITGSSSPSDLPEGIRELGNPSVCVVSDYVYGKLRSFGFIQSDGKLVSTTVQTTMYPESSTHLCAIIAKARGYIL